jgi:uncharacterized membrane protein
VVGQGFLSNNYVLDSPDDYRGFIYKDGIYTEVYPPWPDLGLVSILGITDNGEVVGTMTAWSPQPLFYDRGFIYWQGEYRGFIRKPIWMIGSPDFKSINNNCAVVGEGQIFFWPYSPLNTRWGFIYRGGIYTWLLPPGCWYSIAYGINDQGAVVGSAGNPYSGKVTKGFIYQYGIYIWVLPPGWISAEAYAINNNGAVVGRGLDGTGIIKLFVYSNGTYTELLPPCVGVGYLQHSAINNNGAVVFSTDDPYDNCTTAFIAVPKSN